MSAAAQARARSTAAVFAEAPVMNIKWRASATPTRGGLKLAESPPRFITPGQMMFPYRIADRNPAVPRPSGARRFARHFASDRRKRARDHSEVGATILHCAGRDNANNPRN